jgi:hypothetical protein
VAQAVKCLPSKCEALSSNPSTAKNKEKPKYLKSVILGIELLSSPVPFQV